MLGHYKAPLHRFFDPVARVLFRARVRPNHLTVLGLGVSIAAAYVFSRGSLRSGAALLAVAGLFDFFDGAVARLAGSDSDYGAFLDSVVDRYSDVAVLLGVLVHYQHQGHMTGAVLTMAALAGTGRANYNKGPAPSIRGRVGAGGRDAPR